MTDAGNPEVSTPHGFKPGTVRAALAYRDFRLVWLGSFTSNVGTWIQNVVLPAYVYTRTGKASLVGLMIFAQLGPLLFLAIPAGVIADRFNRRTWLIAMQSVQMVCSAIIGFLALGEPSFAALFLASLGVGIGNALNAPAWTAMLPSLVRPEDLPGAISISSTTLNGARVVGPIIVAVLAQWGVETAAFFFINAVSFLFVMVALWVVHVPPVQRDNIRGRRQFTHGLRIARQRKTVGRMLLTMTTFSLFSLPYVGLFPAVANLNFGIAEDGPAYKWLYAIWGLGASLGGLAIGTTFADYDKRKLTQWGFAGFAAALACFALISTPEPAYIVGFMLGFCYFFSTTSLSTVLQGRLESEVRGRVMALYIMSFGGTVPIGNMIFGPLIDQFGARAILLFGAAWAVFLAWWCDVKKLDEVEAAR
ncbi:MAG: hypothetical protein RLZZ254_785 [Actinomycetota bacterium]